MKYAIQISKLQKSFGKGKTRKQIIKNISFAVQEGEIFGFIGPNGAGKSTIIKMLLQFYTPDSGTLQVYDKKIGHDEFRHLIGYLSEVPFFYEHLTAAECLMFAGRLNGVEKSSINDTIPILLEKMDLSYALHQQIGTFSKGMKQRLGFAAAMIHDPPLYVFDEPMSGLDPMGRHLVKKIFHELHEAGKTIFFSTHILSDIENLCSRIGLIHKGNLLYHGDLKGFSSARNLDDVFVEKIENWDNAQQQ